MNFCNDKNKEAPTALIVGNLYTWFNTPQKINLCIEMDSEKYMVNLRNGQVVATAPEAEHNLSRYTDVTHRFCVKELSK